jgi:predicted transposase YbfD/YdcC
LPKKTFEAVEKAKGQLIVQLKDNQKNLLREVSEGCDVLTPLSSYDTPLEKSRNRLESRTVDVFNVQSCLIESHEWKPYIACAIRVKRHTESLDTKTTKWEVRAETAYYLCSQNHDAGYFARVIREHWHTENCHHYVRDVSLREDASRIRTRPGIFARLRSMALNVLRVNQVTNIKAALFENALDFDGLMAMKGLIN